MKRSLDLLTSGVLIIIEACSFSRMRETRERLQWKEVEIEAIFGLQVDSESKARLGMQLEEIES